MNITEKVNGHTPRRPAAGLNVNNIIISIQYFKYCREDAINVVIYVIFYVMKQV